jgi:hypothetical protein
MTTPLAHVEENPDGDLLVGHTTDPEQANEYADLGEGMVLASGIAASESPSPSVSASPSASAPNCEDDEDCIQWDLLVSGPSGWDNVFGATYAGTIRFTRPTPGSGCTWNTTDYLIGKIASIGASGATPEERGKQYRLQFGSLIHDPTYHTYYCPVVEIKYDSAAQDGGSMNIVSGTLTYDTVSGEWTGTGTFGMFHAALAGSTQGSCTTPEPSASPSVSESDVCADMAECVAILLDDFTGLATLRPGFGIVTSWTPDRIDYQREAGCTFACAAAANTGTGSPSAYQIVCPTELVVGETVIIGVLAPGGIQIGAGTYRVGKTTLTLLHSYHMAGATWPATVTYTTCANPSESESPSVSVYVSESPSVSVSIPPSASPSESPSASPSESPSADPCSLPDAFNADSLASCYAKIGGTMTSSVEGGNLGFNPGGASNDTYYAHKTARSSAAHTISADFSLGCGSNVTYILIVNVSDLVTDIGAQGCFWVNFNSNGWCSVYSIPDWTQLGSWYQEWGAGSHSASVDASAIYADGSWRAANPGGKAGLYVAVGMGSAINARVSVDNLDASG